MSAPVMVPATLPAESSTIRQPRPKVFVVPSVLGALPTITQPDFSITIAVERPTPPGQPSRVCGKVAKVVICWVAGAYFTMVVPVPCRLALLLKLSTRMSPFRMLPADAGATTSA